MGWESWAGHSPGRCPRVPFLRVPVPCVPPWQSFPEMEREARDQLFKEVLGALGELPEKHRALMAQIIELEEQLKHQKQQLGEAQALKGGPGTASARGQSGVPFPAEEMLSVHAQSWSLS